MAPGAPVQSQPHARARGVRACIAGAAARAGEWEWEESGCVRTPQAAVPVPPRQQLEPRHCRRMSETRRVVFFTGEDDFFHHFERQRVCRREGTDVTWRCQGKHHLQEKAAEREFLLTLLRSGLNSR